MPTIDPADGGFMSRKMIMAYATMVLGTLGFLATGYWKALQVSFAAYCTFLLGAAAIYIGGNTAVKLIASKQTAPSEDEAEGEVPSKADR